MADMEITQKEIEDKLFNFIEENFGKKRYECFNEVKNFVEDKLFGKLSDFNYELESYAEDNEQLEGQVDDLYDAFTSLKDDCVDFLESVKSDLEDIIEDNELDSTLERLKDLKKVVENQRRTIENSDCY
jgi:predicted RNase H-like nuclease (RuvC/YqgF family)